jgi:8-oxo-dGTP pyrophosphatase MutT (NUDIX family)
MLQVVGTLFIKNRKLLLNRPRKRPIFQLIAGKMEAGETPLQAVYRESCEELSTNSLDKSSFQFLMEFEETAASDPNLQIHYYLFNYTSEIDCNLTTTEEITELLWYDTTMKDIPLSPTLNHIVIPYCIENNLID